jgi:hypothetical protein
MRVNVLAGSDGSRSPAVVFNGQRSTAIYRGRFISRRHGNATSVNVLTHVSDGHKTNHALHLRILANRRRRRI